MPQVQLPLATEQGDLVNTIQQIRLEASSVRSRFDTIFRLNEDFYNGKQWKKKAPAGRTQITVPRIRRAVTMSVHIQTEQKPHVHLTPRESNDKPINYLSDDGAARITPEDAAFAQLQPAQAEGREPIGDQQVAALMAIPGEAVASPDGMAVQQPKYREDDFVFIDDEMLAHFAQVLLDIMWDESRSAYKWTVNVLNKEIYGHAPALIEWDEDRKCYTFENIHPTNIWIDPTSTGIEDADYCILDQFISAAQAIRLYPEYRDAIEKAKTQRVDEMGGNMSGATSHAFGPWRETDFQRDMVLIQTAWFRDQVVYKSPDEAMADNDVQIDPESQTFITQDGAVEIDQEGWPTKVGIRQVTIIGDQAVEDIECPYDDIPIIWNINLIRPFSPFGIGTPEHLHDLEEAKNRILSNIIDITRYGASPQQVMPASLQKEIKSNAIYSHPGRVLWLNDTLFWRLMGLGGSKSMTLEPPQIPQGSIELLQLLLRLIDEEADNADVLQGRAPGRVESGRAIGMLQESARGTIAFRAVATENAVKQQVRLVLGMIRDFLSPEDLEKMVGGFSAQIWLSWRERFKNAKFDIAVEVVGGHGASKSIKRSKAVQEFTLGLRGPSTTQQMLEINNPEREVQDIMTNPISAFAQQMAQQSGDTAPQNPGADE